MKGKSIAKLTVTLVLIVLFTLLAVFGLKLNRIYSVKSVGQAISLGLDLQGGIATEYMATDTTVENFDDLMESTVSALRERLTNAGFGAQRRPPGHGQNPRRDPRRGKP